MNQVNNMESQPLLQMPGRLPSMPPVLRWSGVVTVVTLQAIITVLLIRWNGWLTPSTIVPPVPPSVSLTQGKVHVLLLSSWRSGSSFLGQVFSQHPNVFYLMEPAWHVWATMRQPGAIALQTPVRDLLRNVFHCDMSSLEAYTPQKRNVSNLFMWSHSRALCSPPACPLTPRNALSNERECSKRCDRNGLRGVQEACRSYSHVVLKEVRLLSLEPLYPLLRDPTIDLHIIHLVRDPRAVAQSRNQAALWLQRDDTLLLEMGNPRSPDALFRVMQEICRSHVQIHETAVLRPPSFLHGRYRLVRYEDMVRNPVGEVEGLYKFAGLNMTPQMKNWIHEVTHGKSNKGPTFKVSSRDAVTVSEAWRTKLPHSKVRHVQDVCTTAMSLLGYLPVANEQEQKKHNLDLLLPLKPNRFTWSSSKNKGKTAH
ncbi:carbohydrate sulfotransferase 6-like [Arapaima gigas]